MHLNVLKKAQIMTQHLSIGPDVLLLGVQHLTPTTVELFKALIEKGLKPENTYLMGKCYSANPVNFHALTKMGIRVSEKSFYFDSHRPYDEVLHENIAQYFGEISNQVDYSKIKKVIILDDGAALLTLKNLNIPKNIEVVGIEQTSSGYRIAQEKELEYPIINVARSEAKLIYETPFITRMVCQKVDQHVKNINLEIKKVLIVGSGPIGQAVYQCLSPNYEVDIVDKSDTNYCPDTLANNLSNYQLVIGCAGANSIQLKQLEKVKTPLALISASSSDREFPAYELRKKAGQYHYFSQNTQIGPIHLINSGFPVNFDDQFLDSRELELTRALLFVSVIQAVNTPLKNTKGFIKPAFQKEIIKSYVDEYKDDLSNILRFGSPQNEISFPLVFKLLKGLTSQKFHNLFEKVHNKFDIERKIFIPFAQSS